MEAHGRAGVALEWLGKSRRTLDLGCSGGLFASLVMGKGGAVVGMDVDAGSLGRARREAPQADFVLGSGEALPYDDGSFDSVVMLDVLEHMPSDARALREVDRVLQPGGRLIISVPNKGHFGFLDAQNSIFFAAGRKIMGRRGEAQFHRHYGIDDLKGLLGPSYRLEKLRYGGYLLFPICGYILMITDQTRSARVSEAIRRIEQVDFDKDRGAKSWHMMAEFVKGIK